MKSGTFALIRRASGDYDLLVIALVALVIVGTLIFLALQIIGQSEEHVEKVRKTKIPYKESLQWRAENAGTEERLESDLKNDPNRVQADYGDMHLNENCMKLIGRMSRLQHLTLTRATVKDSSLRHLTKLPLKSLGLQGTTITNKAIPFILEIPTLRSIEIGDTEVDDEGLRQLASSKSITRIGITIGRCLSNEGVKNLSDMSQLSYLEIGQSRGIDADCLVYLKKLENLAGLNLEDIQFKKDSSRHLTQIKKLTNLQVSNGNTKDSDMAQLASIDSLRALSLINEEISDKGLMYLAKSKHLSSMLIKSCPNITPKGIKEFLKIKPACKVEYVPARKFSENRNRPEIDLFESKTVVPGE